MDDAKKSASNWVEAKKAWDVVGHWWPITPDWTILRAGDKIITKVGIHYRVLAVGTDHVLVANGDLPLALMFDSIAELATAASDALHRATVATFEHQLFNELVRKQYPHDCDACRGIERDFTITHQDPFAGEVNAFGQQSSASEETITIQNDSGDLQLKSTIRRFKNLWGSFKPDGAGWKSATLPLILSEHDFVEPDGKRASFWTIEFTDIHLFADSQLSGRRVQCTLPGNAIAHGRFISHAEVLLDARPGAEAKQAEGKETGEGIIGSGSYQAAIEKYLNVVLKPSGAKFAYELPADPVEMVTFKFKL